MAANGHTYWDANVFLLFLDDEEGYAAPLQALLDRSAQPADPLHIVTSVLSLAEVAYITSEGYGAPNDASLAAIEALWTSPATTLLDIDELVARQARDLMRGGLGRGWRLKPADALHLATAMEYGAGAFSTYDQSLWKYTSLAGMPIAAPGEER